MERKQKASEVLYKKYEYLAKQFAGKVFSYEQLGLEYDDVLQEFRIKLFTTLQTYGKAWAAWRKGEREYKPSPLVLYIKGALHMKVLDFVKLISRNKNKIRIDDIDFDFGILDEVICDTAENQFKINDVDLLEGLANKERVVFSLYLKGFERKLITRVYYSTKEEKAKKRAIENDDDRAITVGDIIEQQRAFLIEKYGEVLLDRRKDVYYSYSYRDDD
jgi:hypothetical protein